MKNNDVLCEHPILVVTVTGTPGNYHAFLQDDYVPKATYLNDVECKKKMSRSFINTLNRPQNKKEKG